MRLRQAKKEVQGTRRKVMDKSKDTARATKANLDDARQSLRRAGETFASGARDTASMTARDLQDTGQKVMVTALDRVSDDPAKYLGAALGVGIVVGLALALLLGIGRTR